MNLKTHTAYAEIGMISGEDKDTVIGINKTRLGDVNIYQPFIEWTARIHQPDIQDPDRKPTDVLKPDIVVVEESGRVLGADSAATAQAKVDAMIFLAPFKDNYLREEEVA